MIKRGVRSGILLVVLLALSGCGITPDRSDKASPDWSRGLRVGVASANQPLAMQVDGKGHIHLVWYTRTEEVSRLHYVQLDEQAKVLVDRDLEEIRLPYPHKPQLLLDGQGNMHLAWLARDDSLKSLFHSLLRQDGEAISEPVRLSLPGKRVESYRMCLGKKGRIEVFWSAEEGIYHLRLNERGDVLSPSTLIVPQGTDPTVQVDNSGAIHLAWLQEPFPQVKELYYTAFEVPEPVEGGKLTQFNVGTGVALRGPVLGLDTENVYIFWSIEQRGGLEAGTAGSFYVSFPLGQPSRLTRSRIRIPGLEPVYVSSPGEYNYHRLAYPLAEWDSDFLAMPAVVEGQRNELAVMFNIRVRFGLKLKAHLEESKIVAIGPERVPLSVGFKPQIQLAMAVFTKGKMKGYQLTAKTGSVSLRPNLVVDPASNLHLTWIDTAGFWRYNVYYASTSPQVKARLDRTSPQDVLLRALHLSWGMLSGLALFPLLAIWFFPPVIWLVLFHTFGGEDDLGARRVQVALGIAMALYLLGAKVLFLPSFLVFTPFLEQVPPQFSLALIWGMPLVILVLAVAATYVYVRRAERSSLFGAFVTFALTDALLTLIIYGPGFFGQG